MVKLIRFLLPYKKRIALMLILLFIQVLGTLYIPTLTASIVNNGIITGDLEYVWSTGGVMLLVALFVSGVSILGTYTSTYIGTGLGRDIRRTLFRKVQVFSANDFNQFGAASMITRSTNDVTQVQEAFSVIIELLLPAPFMTVAGLILAFSKDRSLAAAILIIMLFIVVMAAIIAKSVVPIFEKLQILLDKINHTVRENIVGVRVIRAFNRTQHEKLRADNVFTEYANTAIKANKIMAAIVPFVMVIMNLLTLFIIWVGGQRVAAGSMEIGDIMAITEYAMIILMYLIMGIAVLIMIPRAQTCAVRINAVLEHEPEFSAVAKKRGINSSNAKVEFRQVTFRYDNAEDPVIHNANFVAQHGQTTAIIGGTGAGKSTLGSLLMRLYDVQEGSILVDGKDIREYQEQELRERIGYVPQRAFLFSGTIAQNLRHGKKDATDEEMLKAAKIAQIEEFINRQEKGLYAPVSQGGTNFSGGQKQRLSIARAVIKKPEIYIFDDSFSALDFKTDAKLRAALKQEVANSTVIIVAQRISTIIDADQIIVLDEGSIVGIGTHKELMKSCLVYQQIAGSQLSKEELA